MFRLFSQMGTVEFAAGRLISHYLNPSIINHLTRNHLWHTLLPEVAIFPSPLVLALVRMVFLFHSLQLHRTMEHGESARRQDTGVQDPTRKCRLTVPFILRFLLVLRYPKHAAGIFLLGRR